MGNTRKITLLLGGSGALTTGALLAEYGTRHGVFYYLVVGLVSCLVGLASLVTLDILAILGHSDSTCEDQEECDEREGS